MVAEFISVVLISAAVLIFYPILFKLYQYASILLQLNKIGCHIHIRIVVLLNVNPSAVISRVKTVSYHPTLIIFEEIMLITIIIPKYIMFVCVLIFV